MAITMNQEIPLRVQQPKDVLFASRKAVKVHKKFSAYKLDADLRESNYTSLSQSKNRVIRSKIHNLPVGQRE